MFTPYPPLPVVLPWDLIWEQMVNGERQKKLLIPFEQCLDFKR